MTDAELAPRAKGGDRWAMSELLRRNAKAATAMARLMFVLARRPRLADEAASVALHVLWQCVADWNPERASLLTYARKPLRWAVDDVIATVGASVFVPGNVSSAQAKRARQGRYLDVVVTEDGDTVGDMLRAAPVPMCAAHDAEHMLRFLPANQAECMWRAACDETLDDIATSRGVTRQAVHQAIARGEKRAREVFGEKDKRAA